MEPKENKGRWRIVFLAIELILLCTLFGAYYLYTKLDSKLDVLVEEQQETEFEEEKVLINPEVQSLSGYTTYALFGIDHRDKNPELNTQNSDTIIIACVNNDTKSIRLVSVYRDTYLNIGNNKYTKANAAYAKGGVEQAISMLNTNLDLDITDYVSIDFNALVTAVDLVGGLDMPLSYAEIVHMNSYCVETAEETEKDYTPIELPEEKPEDEEAILGTYHLNGVQATSYCRIRYTSSMDMGRTERQRRTIEMIVQKAKKAGLGTIFNMMDEIFPLVKTSLDKKEIKSLLPVLFGYTIDETAGFPFSFKFSNVSGSCIVATDDLLINVRALHKFLYGEENVYEPSPTVLEISQTIYDKAGGLEVPVEAVTEAEDAVTETEESSTTKSTYSLFDYSYNNYSSSGNDSGSYDYYGYDKYGNYHWFADESYFDSLYSDSDFY